VATLWSIWQLGQDDKPVRSGLDRLEAQRVTRELNATLTDVERRRRRYYVVWRPPRHRTVDRPRQTIAVPLATYRLPYIGPTVRL